MVPCDDFMASQSLALPGILFVGEDERARLVAHLGPAAGWMIPKGVLGWSHEVSVVSREALGEDIRREAKIVMPEEQIPKGRMPLTHQAALKSPLVGVSGKLTQKLVESGIRVHTVGADRITSSFYYIAEGGGEPAVRVEGDLVAAVGAMLGDRADNAAIERVLDGIVDRLVRSLSKDRVNEISLELAAALPRAAADGTGTQDVDLESFEQELSALVGASEKYTPFLQEIATKITDASERKVDIPLFGDARKVSQGPFELTVGEQAVTLVTHERWLATGPLQTPREAAPMAEPARAKVEAAPAVKVELAKVASRPEPTARTEPVRVEPAKVEPAVAPESKPATPRPAPSAPISVGNIRPLAAPLSPPRPASNPPAAEVAPAPVAAAAPTQSGSTERPPAAQPATASAAEPQPTPEPLPVIQMETPTTPVVVPAREPRSAPTEPKETRAATPREERLPVKAASSAPVAKAEEKGFPWLLVLVVLAAIAAAAFFFTRR